MIIFHLKLCCGVFISIIEERAKYPDSPDIPHWITAFPSTEVPHELQLIQRHPQKPASPICYLPYRIQFQILLFLPKACLAPQHTSDVPSVYRPSRSLMCHGTSLLHLTTAISKSTDRIQSEQPAPTVVNLPNVSHIFSKVANSKGSIYIKASFLILLMRSLSFELLCGQMLRL